MVGIHVMNVLKRKRNRKMTVFCPKCKGRNLYRDDELMLVCIDCNIMFIPKKEIEK